MKNNKYNSGEIHVGPESEDRFASSSFVDDTKKSYIAILASILVLVIVTCTFFVAFADVKLPVWNPIALITTEKPDDTETPSAPVYVATEGGKGMYQMDLYSEYAILVSLSDMTTVAHKYADEIIYPASMTKVMTITVALELIDNFDDKYVVTKEVISQIPHDAASAGLKDYVGETISVRDILFGISYCSGADSVMCLLDYLGLSLEDFVALMNEKAREIGMQSTTFGGAIGMDDENNQTTCRDIAALMAYAMENPDCVELFGGVEYKLDYGTKTYYHSTLNTTLGYLKYTPKSVLGGKYTLRAAKSGYEIKAGRCLVSYIKSNETGEYFVLVTANATHSKYKTIEDMQTIFDEFNP